MSGPLSGDYTRQETRVPIPNTTVKLTGPMIVPTSAKVGYRRDFTWRSGSLCWEPGRFFCAATAVAFLLLIPHTGTAQDDAPTATSIDTASRRLLDSLPRERQHRTLLLGARQRLELSDSNSALPLIQAVLDSPNDSFLADGGAIRSARLVALQLLRSHPAAGTRRYQDLFGPEAARLLRQADQRDGTQRIVALQQVARRFRLTNAGFESLNRLATIWLDHGHPELAWRALTMMATEPVHRRRLSPAVRLKMQAASRLTGLPIPGGLDMGADRLGQLTREIQPDWPLPLGPTRPRRPHRTSAPVLSEAWHSRLSNPEDSSPLAAWSSAQRADGRLTGAMALFPIVVDQQIILRDQAGIRSLSLNSGATLWRYSSPCTWHTRHRAFDRLVPVVRSGSDRLTMALAGNPRFGMITSDGQRVFAVQLSKTPVELPPPSRRIRGRANPEFSWPSELVALPLTPHPTPAGRPGNGINHPLWTYPSATATTRPMVTPAPNATPDPVAVLGPATPAGGLLLVLTEQQRQVDLAALDPATGRSMWTQPLAHSDVGLNDAGGADRHSTACIASQAAGLAICTTGTGITVTLNLVDGTLRWASDSRPASDNGGFPRTRRSGLASPPRGDPGLANLPLVTNGHVVLLSPTSDQLKSVNLETGRPLWSRGRSGLEYVAAVTDRTLLAIGPTHVEGLDHATGRVSWRRRPGLVSGRGVRLSQDRYLVPLKSGRITCLEIDTGHEIGLSLPPAIASPTRPTPVGLFTSNGIRPGNLVVAGNWVLSLTADRITAYPQAAEQLTTTRTELAADPKNERLQLQAAELHLALGQHEESLRILESIASSNFPPVRQRSRRVLRELLFLQLDTARSLPSSQAGPLLKRLGQLADSPRDLARVLVEEGRWHLQQGDPLQAFESATRLASLAIDTPPQGITEVTADRDGTHVLTRRSWITSLSRESIKLATTRGGDTGQSLTRRLDTRATALAKSASLDEQLTFVRRHTGNPLADPVRLSLADRLIDTGRFQQAELLLLAIRKRGQPRWRLPATMALVQLWSRFGLYEDCVPLLDELAIGPLSTVRGPDGITGDKWVATRPPNNLAVSTWQRHRHSTPRPGRVEIIRDDSVSATVNLPPTYQKFRRQFSTSERETFDLLETYTDSTRRMTLMDRKVGVAAGHIDLPTQFSARVWWHQCRSGHLFPMGSHSSMLGLSLLERNRTAPLWKRPYLPLASRPEMLRVGPSGVLAVSFQSRQHLLACSPVDGELLWRRGDLETGSGTFADATSGFFGDDHVLVVSQSDRIAHDVYDSLTGVKLRRSRLPITARTRRRSFGRHLMYVTVEPDGSQRLRVWDPRDDRTIIDERLKDRIFPYATPDHHLAWIDDTGRLKVHDFREGVRRLTIQALSKTDERISSIKVFRDRDCYYVAMLPAQGAAPPRAGNAPVYFVGDTLLPVIHVHGHLLAIDSDTATLRWRRTVALRSVVRFRHDHLPALVLLGRTRDRGNGGRQRMLVELLDARTGRTLLLDEKLPTDRIVLAWYDPEIARLELQGLKSRITVDFRAD